MRLAALSILLVAPVGLAQDVVDLHGSESQAARDLLGRIEAAIRARDWKRLSEHLQSPEPWEDSALVSAPDRPGVAVPLAGVVGGIVRSLPAAVLAEVRGHQDPTAKLWFDEWVRTGDERQLLNVAQERFHSSWGARAADLLAARAMERGERYAAVRWWNRILESGALDSNRPVIAARAAHAMGSNGGSEGLRAFLDRTTALVTDGPVVVGGERTTLHRFLDSLRPAVPEPTWSRTSVPAGAGEPSFSGEAIVVDHPTGPILGVLSSAPTRLRAYRIVPEGKPEFLWEERVEGLEERQRGGGKIRIYVTPDRLAGAEGVIVASMGHLAGFDAATGGLRWSIEKPALPPADLGDGWSFSTPLVRSGRLLVPGVLGLDRASDAGFVTCLDLQTAAVQWVTRIPLPVVARMLPGLTAHDGFLYYGGHGGSVACLDEETGALQWVAATKDELTSRRGQLESTRCAAIAPVVSKGRVIVPAAEKLEFTAVSAATGARLDSPGRSTVARHQLRGLLEVGDGLVCIGPDHWTFIGRPVPGDARDRRPISYLGIANGAAYAHCMMGAAPAVLRLEADTGRDVEVIRLPPMSAMKAVALWNGRLLLAGEKEAGIIDVRPVVLDLVRWRAAGPHSPADLFRKGARAWWSGGRIEAGPLLAEFVSLAREEAAFKEQATWARSLAGELVRTAKHTEDPRRREIAALAALTLGGSAELCADAMELLRGALADQDAESQLAERLFGILADLAPRNPADLDGIVHKVRVGIRLLVRELWWEDRSALVAIDRRAGEALAGLDEADRGGLFRIAARYPMTPSASEAISRLYRMTRGSRELAALRELTRETAEALSSDERRELRDAIEGILPDVDDREAELLERLSDWIQGLPERR